MSRSRSRNVLAGDNSGLIVAGLVVVVFVAFYRRNSEFGLYTDDPAIFGGLINRDWPSEIENVWYCLTRWPLGRPLGMGINLGLLPFMVAHLSGLGGLHAAAFVIVAANCALLYRLVGRYHPPMVALSAAGFYALAPADTVQISMVYAYNFEIAILFGILSAGAALRGQRIWFLVALCTALLMVEPVVMFVLLAPLFLGFRRERSWLSWALRHVAMWAIAVLAVLVTRRLVGDPAGSERVSEMAVKPFVTLQSGLTSASTGFRTHFELVFERMVQPFKEADARLWLVMLGAGTIASLIVWAARRDRATPGRLPSGPGLSRQAVDQAGWWPGFRLLLAGCAIMLAVYFCYFRQPWYPANWRTGFMSGVHVVATLGSCLVLAALVSLLMTAITWRFQPAVSVLLVLVFTGLAGFGELVQRDYANSWVFQRNFWQAYARLCPDATEGTFVLVLDRNLPPIRYIDLFSWSDEVLPDAIFQYSRDLPRPVFELVPKARTFRPPSVILTAPELATDIRYEGRRYVWKPTYYFMLPKTPEQQPEEGNVIVMVYDGRGTWQRLAGDVAVDGGILPLRPPGGDDQLRRAHKSPLAAVYGL
jgi:hypothetical protein